MRTPTRLRLLNAGLALMRERGHDDLGIGIVLPPFRPQGSLRSGPGRSLPRRTACAAGGVPFRPSRAPLERIRAFLEPTRQAYASQGYPGSLPDGRVSSAVLRVRLLRGREPLDAMPDFFFQAATLRV